jgi:Flp pilus assembly protein TadD
MNSRIPQLTAALEKRPADPFLLYALGVEHVNEGSPAQARNYFAEVYAKHPKYVPLYLHFGGLLDQLGEKQEARRMYEQGLVVATAAADRHAASELQTALDLLAP